jgi:hypothetical protein
MKKKSFGDLVLDEVLDEGRLDVRQWLRLPEVRPWNPEYLHRSMAEVIKLFFVIGAVSQGPLTEAESSVQLTSCCCFVKRMI